MWGEGALEASWLHKEKLAGRMRSGKCGNCPRKRPGSEETEVGWLTEVHCHGACRGRLGEESRAEGTGESGGLQGAQAGVALT